MSYDTAPPASAPPQRPLRTDFLQYERFVFILGAMGVGALVGFVTAIAVGRQDFWTHFLTGAPVLALALCLTIATYVEARRRGAFECSVMAACNAGALILWPVFLTLPPMAYMLAPLTTLLSGLLLASCWTGTPGAIYRAGAQTVLVSALAAHQGAVIVIGSVGLN